MEKYDLLKDRDEKRDIHNLNKKKFIWIENNVPSYKPFNNVDKRFVAQCFQDFNLWSYYDITISCFRDRNTPDMIYNEEPCKECWSCLEKKMAFGTYDGGVI